jgi:hypothetical protein
MSEIIPPRARVNAAIDSIKKLIECLDEWHDRQHVPTEESSLYRIWFRGNARPFQHPLCPKVYRRSFLKRAQDVYPNSRDPAPVLERELLKEFMMSGAHQFGSDNVTDIYFTAQHFGMPTRLLDWTMNPLIALFFAVKDCPESHGEIFIMDALGMLPDRSSMTEEDRINTPSEILTMRDGHVENSISPSFWVCPKPEPRRVATTSTVGYTTTLFRYEDREPLILPVRPDNRPGRIGQQSSCFTLHGVGAASVSNPMLDAYVVERSAKARLLHDLRRLSVNQFSIFNDLDHLSSEITGRWRIPIHED